jgi:hypothetical protein
VDNQDESTNKNMGETGEEVQDLGLTFDNDLNLDVDDTDIEEDDHVFMAVVHLVDHHHSICALNMVFRHLAEASAKNSKPKGIQETMPTSLHGYANIFSEMAFDTFP